VDCEEVLRIVGDYSGLRLGAGKYTAVLSGKRKNATCGKRKPEGIY